MESDQDAVRSTEARRLSLLAELGAPRKSVVISYLTSTRPGSRARVDDDDIQVIERHVRAARDSGARNIDLFILTYGGDAVAPWGLIAMLREYFKTGNVRVIVPWAAFSAGASISLGADEIVMGPGSMLGPSDTQYGTREDYWGPVVSASDLQAFFDLAAERGPSGGHAKARMMDWLTSRTDVQILGAMYRAGRENYRKIINILESRHPPLTRSQNEQIARFMLYGIGNHGQAIRRTELRKNGVRYITNAEDTGLEAEITELFEHYAAIMKLNTPFVRPMRPPGLAGDEIDFDVNGVHYSATPIAIVESEFDTNLAYVAYGFRHWNEVPSVPAVDPRKPKVEPEPSASRTLWMSVRAQARSASLVKIRARN